MILANTTAYNRFLVKYLKTKSKIKSNNAEDNDDKKNLASGL